MDWKKEKESLKQAQNRNWWKPTTGQHKIKILTDGEEYQYEFDDGIAKKVIQKIRFEVEIAENKLDWGVSKGISESSLYGQLSLVGAERGTLIGTEITLVVKGSGMEISYTVLEALDLMTKPEEKVE